MNVFTTYGVGIEGDLAFDALPKTFQVDPAIRIRVDRISDIEDDPGVPVRPCVAQNRIVRIVSHEAYVAVQVDRLFCFDLWLSARRIDCRVLTEVSDDLLRYWVLQQILPLFLLLNGSMEFLHGMAVSAMPGVASSSSQGQSSSHGFKSSIGFLGESHAGKSTLLNFFLSRGHALVTDDHLALSRRSYTTVLPAPPFYRAYRAAEDLGVRAGVYSPHPTELRRLYLLEPARPDTNPRLERLTGMAGVAALFPNIHYSLHNPQKPDFFPLVEDRFRGLADIVRKVPFARLHVPRSLDRLSEVYDLIQNDQVN